MVDSIGSAVRPDSSIELVLELEKQTLTVNQAIQVKRAGLAAVHDAAGFLQLTRIPDSNPSEAYQSAVSRFISENVGRY
jgi:hypothetical protein